MYLCLSALPFLTSRGLAEEHADTRVSDTTVSDLIAALKDPDPIVRQGVAITLGGLRKLAAAAVPVLIEALKDLDPHTSSIVARALVSIAIAAQDAAATAMIAPLKAAHNALSDRGLHSQAQSVKRAIDFLELLWWKNLTEWLLRWIHEWSVRESAIRIWTDHCAKFSKRLC
jgi:HEAT repeat protein